MPMEMQTSKLFFQIYCLQRTAENFLVPPLWEKKRMFDFFFPPTAADGAIYFFRLQVVNTFIETRSSDVRRSIST